MDYTWYSELIDDQELQQGDFVPECPIVVPPANFEGEGPLAINIQLIDSIVVSQSCDLVRGKVEIVLVCPYYPLKYYLDSLPKDRTNGKGKAKEIENLRKGFIPGYHLLNRDKVIGLLSDYQVVDFKNVYGVHFELLHSITTKQAKRVRLLPPYREHLSQSFARYFMRVGLPQDIVVEGY